MPNVLTTDTPTDGVIDPFTGRARFSDGMDTLRNIEFLQFADQTVSVASLNPNAAGAAILSDNSPTEGQVVSADVSGISDVNGIVSSTIQWQVSSNAVDWQDVPGAVGPDFTPEDLAGTEFGAQAGLFLRAAFIYEDGLGFINTLYSAMTQPIGVNWDGLSNFIGTAGDDIAAGSAAAENLYGMEGNDQLSGGDGADNQFGGVGADTTTGGLGNDTHHVDNAGDVVLEAVGEGNPDRVMSSVNYVLTAGSEVELMFAKGAADIDLTGNAFDNYIQGNAGSNSLYGADVNDRVFGFGGDDVVEGGDGDDQLYGGAGVDTSDGGFGNDTHHVENAGDIIIEGVGQGDLDIVLSSVSYALTAGAEVEVMFAKGNANIDLAGNEFDNNIWGNGGMNVLSGEGGNDKLFGAGEADMLFGGEGNDQLFGGLAADSMNGGFGDDVMHVNNADDTITELVGQGHDMVGTNVSYVLTAGAEVEVMFSKGAAAINLTGHEFANSIWGNAANNVLSGEAGDDMIGGGAGIDTISGGAGNDILYGQDGDDVIIQTGLTDGRDLINGGAGVDTWQLNAGAGEEYTIFTRAEALAAGITGIEITTEIVVTLNGTDNASIIAELDNIEEIVIDSIDVASGGTANGGMTASGATVNVVGDFTPTSLDLNTITINGGAGNDLVNITQLTSPHRIKFDATQGFDQVIGELRPQDEVTFADGVQLGVFRELIAEMRGDWEGGARSSDVFQALTAFIETNRSPMADPSGWAHANPFGQGPANFSKDDLGSAKFAPFEDGLFETFLF